MQIRSVGIDLGKTTFHLVALGDNGKVLLEEEVHPEAVDCLYCEHADLFDRDGSLFGRTSSAVLYGNKAMM